MPTTPVSIRKERYSTTGEIRKGDDMQYQVIEAESTELLTKKVTAQMEQGWSPFGDLVVGSSPRMFYREMMQWNKAAEKKINPNSEYGRALLALSKDEGL